MMPYARAPGRSVTADTSGRARRDSPGAAIGHEAARHEGAPYRLAALAAAPTPAAGAALSRHRRVRRPPIGRLPPIDTGATVVQLTSVASGTAVGGGVVNPGAPSLAAGGGGNFSPGAGPARGVVSFCTASATRPLPPFVPRS